MTILDKEELEGLQKLRRELHMHPEVSGEEKETSERILQFIEGCDPEEIIQELGGYGIVATFDSGNSGKHIMLRAELDALPIHEINDFEHKSKFDGKGHKCGHDGHMVILCAVAKILSKKALTKGKVSLLFQPAEENGTGARSMINEKSFANLQPDCIFALHNLPGYELNEVVCKEGNFSAAVETILIDLEGKTSHAAEPEKGINPAMAMAEIIQFAKSLENFKEGGDEYDLITPVHFNLGKKAYGISAGKAHLAFTLRSSTNAGKLALSENFENKVREIAKANQLKIGVSREEVFSAIENDLEMNEIVADAAEAVHLKVQHKIRPFRWGEDFGLFTERIPGAMFGLGAGKDMPALHNPDYDFPDELIESGSTMFNCIINNLNK